MVHVAIVGACYGSAGVAVADELHERRDEFTDDLELALIDDGDPGGGLCILRGCMPSKGRPLGRRAPVSGASRRPARGRPRGRPRANRRSQGRARLELRRPPPEPRPRPRRSRRRRTPPRYRALRRRPRARRGGRRLEPDYVVVATGSAPNIPELPGIDEVPLSNQYGRPDATAFPDSGIVLGNGYISLELGPYLSEIGDVDLTVIEHDERPLEEMEDAYGDTVLDIYRDQFGIEVLTNTDEKRLEATADGGVRLIAERTADGERADSEREGRRRGRSRWRACGR